MAAKGQRLFLTPLWIGVVLLLTLNGLFLGFMLGSQSMQATTNEMLSLTRSMNKSTTESMARIETMLRGVNPQDVAEIVDSTKRFVGDLASISGPFARSGNLSALAEGARVVFGSINPHEVAAVFRDAASIMQTVDGGVRALNVTDLAKRAVAIVQVLDPVVLRTVLVDVRNVTSDARMIMDRLETTHTIQMRF